MADVAVQAFRRMGLGSMAAPAEHIARAAHHERFAARVAQDWAEQFSDWTVTGLFYAAVHYRRALL